MYTVIHRQEFLFYTTGKKQDIDFLITETEGERSLVPSYAQFHKAER